MLGLGKDRAAQRRSNEKILFVGAALCGAMFCFKN